jgi:hypothetical protein
MRLPENQLELICNDGKRIGAQKMGYFCAYGQSKISIGERCHIQVYQDLDQSCRFEGSATNLTLAVALGTTSFSLLPLDNLCTKHSYGAYIILPGEVAPRAYLWGFKSLSLLLRFCDSRIKIADHQAVVEEPVARNCSWSSQCFTFATTQY